MAHNISPDAEAILDQEFKVLDNGFIRLVDYLGSDSRIVQAARVSYGDGTKTVREDRGLINYLIKNAHWSPFEQVILTFHIKLPIFVARQWIRHRTARVNEISARYSVMKDEFYVPSSNQLKYQSKNNKQGRSDEELSEEDKSKILQSIIDSQTSAFDHYKEMIDLGLSRELSRIVLPVNLYTEWYWQVDLRNLFNFLKLRMDFHAQFEIRSYANVMADITKKVAPISYEAFEEHVLYAQSFSRSEISSILSLINNKTCLLQGKDQKELFRKLGLNDES